MLWVCYMLPALRNTAMLNVPSVSLGSEGLELLLVCVCKLEIASCTRKVLRPV